MNFKCDTPENIKRAYGTGFKLRVNADRNFAQQLFNQENSKTDVQAVIQRKVQEVTVMEDSTDLNGER